MVRNCHERLRMRNFSPSNPPRGANYQTDEPVRLNQSIRKWLDTLPDEARRAVEKGMAEG
jgi:hypothetical protein